MEKILTKYLKFVIAHPAIILLAVLLITVGSGTWLVVCKPLSLDTNFTTLLPQDLPCVVESHRIRKFIGATDYLIVSVESPVPDDNRAFIEDMVPRLEAMPEITWVTVNENKDFFRDRLLLYMDVPDLENVVKRAKNRVNYEKKIANPFYISLDDEKPPDISFDDIMEKYRVRLKKQGVRGLIKEKPKNSDKKENTKEKKFEKGDYLAHPNGTVFTATARTTSPSTDMNFARSLVEKTQKIIDENNPRRNSKMRAEVVGAFRNRYREFNNILGDIFSSLAVSLGLILLIIVAYFRRVRSVALVFIPLVVGIIWTVSLTALTLERLNMVTALIFAVLLGLGIDFGVHMSMRYLDERARKKSLEESLKLALTKTGKAILTAGLTTAGALAVLIVAKFKGFSEFGIIAMMGIILCLVAYTLLLPAMAVAMEKVSVPKPWRKRESDPAKELRPITTSRAKLGIALGLIVALAGAGVWGLTKIEFEYNFRNLRGKNVSTTIRYGKSLGQGTSPVVALMPTPEDARVLTRHLDQIAQGEISHPLPLRKSYSIFSFIPDNQPQKIKLLGELHGYVNDALKLKKLKASVRARLEEIQNWTVATEFGIDDLPEWVLAKFREKDGTVGRMVYLDPGIDELHVDKMAAFYDEYGEIKVPGKGVVRPSASSFILVEVVRAVQKDGMLMTVVATGVVLLLLLIDLRSIRKALFVFFPLVVGLLWTGGLMALLGIRVGLYNMLVLPTLLGVGIDASVHLYHSYTERGPGSLRISLKTTGVAIFIAASTTGVGFVGMTIVNHQGLRSIGIMAIIGIGACLAGALTTLPLLLALRESWGRAKTK